MKSNATGFTPYEMMTNKKAANLIGEKIEFPPGTSTSQEERVKLAAEQMAKVAALRKHRHDSSFKPIKYKINDLVLVKTKERSSNIDGETKKLFELYHGPFIIAECPHPNAYRLEYPKSRKPLGLRNVTELRLYKQLV